MILIKNIIIIIILYLIFNVNNIIAGGGGSCNKDDDCRNNGDSTAECVNNQGTKTCKCTDETYTGLYCNQPTPAPTPAPAPPCVDGITGSSGSVQQTNPCTNPNKHQIYISEEHGCACREGWLGANCQIEAAFRKIWTKNDYIITLYYNYDSTNFYGQIISNQKGWVGLIFGANRGMDDGDCWFFRIQGTVVEAKDQFSTGKNQPTDDLQQDLTGISGYEPSIGGTIVNFQRLLTLTHSETNKDRQLCSCFNSQCQLNDNNIVGNEVCQVSWAADVKDSYSKHDEREEESGVDLVPPSSSKPSNQAPISPGFPSLIDSASDSLTIAWADPSSKSPNPVWAWGGGEISEYNVRYRQSGTSTYTFITVTSNEELPGGSYTISGLEPETSYEIGISAKTQYGESPYTNDVTLTTSSSSTQKPAVSIFLNAGVSGYHYLEILWEDTETFGSTLLNYHLQYRKEGDNNWLDVPFLDGNTVVHTCSYKNVTNLIDSTTYEFRVRAENTNGWSEQWSDILSRTTLTYPPCTNNCNGHGTCFRSKCQCTSEWLGLYCEREADFFLYVDKYYNHKISWSYDNTYIYMGLHFHTPGYLGFLIGYNGTSGMSHGDAWLAFVNDNYKVIIEDSYSPDEIQPLVDPSQDLFNVLGYQIGNYTHISFTRKLSTGDIWDRDIVEGWMNCSWSIGPDDFFLEHGTLDIDRDIIKVNFLQPTGTPYPPLNFGLNTKEHTSITLKWDLPLYNGSGIVTNFTLQQLITPPNNYLTLYEGYSFIYTINNLEANTGYTFRIRANNRRGSGTYATSGTIYTKDYDPPTFPNNACPSSQTLGTNINIPAPGGVVATWSNPYAVDLRDGTINTYSSFTTSPQGLTNGSIFRVGTNQINYIFIDSSDNSATCTFTITVEDDDAPVIQEQPGCSNNRILNAAEYDPEAPYPGQTLIYESATALDNVDGFLDPVVTFNPNAQKYPVTATYYRLRVNSDTNQYDTIVTETFTDAKGNSVQCTFTVTINDISKPSFQTCPQPITKTADVPGGAEVTWSEPVVVDNVDSSITATSQSQPTENLVSGSTFPVGTTTIVYTATDKANNAETCSFTVTVGDNGAPTLNPDCPTSFTISTDSDKSGGTATWITPKANDAVDGDDIPVKTYTTGTITPAIQNGEVFPLGSTTVTYVWEDSSQNTVDCSFIITVEDTVPPQITGCPQNITQLASVSTTVTWTTPQGQDNVDGERIPTLTTSPTPNLSSGSTFPRGTTVIQYRFTDTSQNQSVCQFIIKIIDDIAPELSTCPANIQVEYT